MQYQSLELNDRNEKADIPDSWDQRLHKLQMINLVFLSCFDTQTTMNRRDVSLPSPERLVYCFAFAPSFLVVFLVSASLAAGFFAVVFLVAAFFLGEVGLAFLAVVFFLAGSAFFLAAVVAGFFLVAVVFLAAEAAG